MQLNPQAHAFLGEMVRKHSGRLPAAVEEKLKALDTGAATDAPVVVKLDELEKLLREAMPEKSEWIDQACNVASGYHADGTNAQFLTQILSARNTRINEVQAGSSSPVKQLFPLYAEFTMDPKAHTVFLFNARDVDHDGNPLLGKILIRMTPKLEAVVKAGEKEIDGLVKRTFEQIRARWNPAGLSEQHVRAYFGLPVPPGVDMAQVDSIKASTNFASWTGADGPAAKTRCVELQKEIDEAKQRYIDGQLPELDLSRYRRNPPDSIPAIGLVGARDTLVQSIDDNKPEFRGGDPLRQISVGVGGKEISSSVLVRPEDEEQQRAWSDPANSKSRADARYDSSNVNDALDKTPVATYDDRIRIEVRSRPDQTATPGAWLTTPNALSQFAVKLHVDRGLIWEPGSQATVSVLGTSIATSIRPDDTQILGNSPQSVDVNTSQHAAQSMQQFLTSPLDRSSWAQAGKSDAQPKRFTVSDLVYANAASIHVGSRTLQPLGDTKLKQDDLAANKIKFDTVPIADSDKDAVRVRLTLDEGFLGGDPGKANVKGWTVKVGYFDAANKWVEAERRTVGSETSSKAEHFAFDIDQFQVLQRPKDANAKHLEIRLYNADGVPAERIQIPFREAVWGDG